MVPSWHVKKRSGQAATKWAYTPPHPGSGAAFFPQYLCKCQEHSKEVASPISTWAMKISRTGASGKIRPCCFSLFVKIILSGCNQIQNSKKGTAEKLLYVK